MTTREKLLQVSFDEIYLNGYSGTSIDKILKKAQMNKGSMYHLFKSKKELVLAVIEENLMGYIENKYTPLFAFENDIIEEMLKLIKNRDNFDFINGCKLNNLVQELSSKDNDFKNALEKVYLRFESIIEEVLKKAIYRGELKEIDTRKMAMFVVASIEGCLGTGKKSQNRDLFDECISQLEIFFCSLKA